MNPGDIALTSLPQSDGAAKIRPVLLLKRMPPFSDFLVCGVSSQLQQEVVGFDHVIGSGTPDFAGSGLKTNSVVRLGFLAVLSEAHLVGKIGSISGATVALLRQRLGEFLLKP